MHQGYNAYTALRNALYKLQPETKGYSKMASIFVIENAPNEKQH